MASEEIGKKFTFPTAYTVLFILLILVVIATWFVPAGQYDKSEDGEPIPGTYHQVESNPQRIIADGLLAPVNGMYGIEGEDGSVSVYNIGSLYGAIDVALFVLVIGGFLAMTMATGAIDAGIGKITIALEGKEKWMIAVLMIVFALGGTSYGMAEESLAFYGLIIAVMIAAGYDAIDGGCRRHARGRHRRVGLYGQPLRHRCRLRLRRHLHRRWAASRACLFWWSGRVVGIIFVTALCGKGQEGPDQVACLRPKRGE